MENPKTKKAPLEIGCYHFNPCCTNNYAAPEHFVEMGDNNNPIPKEVKLREFEDVLKAGYFNTVILEYQHIGWEEIWQLAEKYNVTVWYDIFELYNSEKGTIEEFLEPYLKKLEVARNNPKYWDRFNGFVFDENTHRGQTPEDFNATCKYLYEKYKKRNFPVFAPNEISELWQAPGLGRMTPEAFKYVTDVAFDVYAVDVRPEANNGYIVRDSQVYYPDVVDGKSFYKVLTDGIVKMAGHPVNVWFYPCAQTKVNTPSKLNTTKEMQEDFVIKQLEFFDEALKSYEYYGGVILYTYTQYYKGEYGLQSHIDIKDENGKQKFRPEDDQIWYEYSKLILDLTEKYRNSEVTLITDPVL